MLASFTRKLQDDEWDDSALANDVATLTYEQALLATCPSRAPETTVPVLHEQVRASESSSSAVHGLAHRTREKKQRSASITIRVTPEEQAQLHERASAAHLTVSAYLRSCIFEAESLRSQVKEALAKMQSPQNDLHPIVEPLTGWRKLFLPIWSQNKLPRDS